jgi:hypothetical protein
MRPCSWSHRARSLAASRKPRKFWMESKLVSALGYSMSHFLTPGRLVLEVACRYPKAARSSNPSACAGDRCAGPSGRWLTACPSSLSVAFLARVAHDRARVGVVLEGPPEQRPDVAVHVEDGRAMCDAREAVGAAVLPSCRAPPTRCAEDRCRLALSVDEEVAGAAVAVVVVIPLKDPVRRTTRLAFSGRSGVTGL